jgi:hypothetical protein
MTNDKKDGCKSHAGERALGNLERVGLKVVMKKSLRVVLAIAVVFGFAGCSKPLPGDKANYAGDWRSADMRLVITAGGRVDYTRRASGGSKSVQAPIQKFEGNDFVAGLGPMNTRFVVARPPTLINGVWTMTVDGGRADRRALSMVQ